VMRFLPHAALASAVTLLCSLTLLAQAPVNAPARAPRTTHVKAEHMVPMRDGVKLHTAVYAPRTCPAGGAPIVLQRTPYGSNPYGADAYPSALGPASLTSDPGYIVVYQDVRGRYLSEGVWEEVRPYVPGKTATTSDESSDSYDTIEWLVTHVPCNNGRVGMWGISYPGFYALAALIDAHPALAAVSPQAPVTDYYLGDDSYHNGAFLLAHNFSFYVDYPPRGPQPRRPQATKDFDYGTRDGYAFYLRGGSLAELTRKYNLTDNPYWRQNLEHTTYDDFWKARSIWRHFRDVTPAVLVVGGWFDAEDLSGPLRTFRVLRQQSPETTTYLAMGPWTHGGWARSDGAQVAQVRFGEPTSRHYRDAIERPFFERHLRGRTDRHIPAVSIFETGSNRWQTFAQWPAAAAGRTYYLSAAKGISTTTPSEPDAFDSYVSDPANPVPAVGTEAIGMPRDYMASDQRFAAARPDVLVYRSPVLTEDVTVAGPIGVRLHVATSGTDADFVVKVLDEYGAGHPQAGAQQLVRGEPFRGKFRKSLETPVAFTPNQPDEIAFDLPDVAHTFRRGHRIVVHVQSSWFPIFDRNPQTFTDIPNARPEQFVKATHRVYRSATRPSHIVLPVVR
jgi:putative CocE/NonD family hydrolase